MSLGFHRPLAAAVLLLFASHVPSVGAQVEVISWVPPYAMAECRAAVEADFGACDARDGLTRVGLQFWVPVADGSLKYADHEWTIPGDADVAWWRAWTRANDIECLLTIYNNIGSWDWSLARAAFADNRSTFVAALIAEMERHDLDGIDLDLEGVGDFEADRAAFAAFVSELSTELRTRGKTLTIDSFHYIWNAPNHQWWSDWLGQVDAIHSMGYDDLHEGGTGYQKYSFQQQAALSAGYEAADLSMGVPSWLASWGVSTGRGTSALAHVEEIHLDLPAPSGLAIWDLQLSAWQDSDLWCAITELRAAGGPVHEKKSLVVMLDGVRADGIITADTPAIDSLIDGTFGGGRYAGAWTYAAQTIQDGPTSSAWNHVSVVTGVGAVRHGVTDNSAAGMQAVDWTSTPHYLTTLEEADPDLGTAFLITWGEDIGMTSGADYVVDASDEENVQRLVAMLAGTHEDPAGDEGSWALGADVDAVTLFLDDVDLAGHANGFSPRLATYLDEVEAVDEQLGRILAAIEARPSFEAEDWQFVITSDHGGLGTGHGGLNPNSETIPFIVAGRTTEQGLLGGRVSNQDAASTAIAHHLGDAAVPAHHEGEPRGGSVLPTPPATLRDGLLLHLPFDADFRDATPRGNDAAPGPESDVDPVLAATGGACGGYLEVRSGGGGDAGASYLSLGSPADLEFGPDASFSLATWVRLSQEQAGDSVILGNKDWASGLNVGTLLLANEGDGSGLGLNLADGVERRDVEAIDFDPDEWWLVVVSVDRSGMAVTFAVGPDDSWHVVADFADDLGDLRSVLPWNIGQDGTGTYAFNFEGDLDELMVWNRALTLDDVRRLHAGEGGACDLDWDRDGVDNDVDCASTDGGTWASPDAVGVLRVDDAALPTLGWAAPANPGAVTVLYDVLRSTGPGDFTLAACLAQDSPVRTATDTEPAAPLFAYVVRAENACGSAPAGGGPLPDCP